MEEALDHFDRGYYDAPAVRPAPALQDVTFGPEVTAAILVRVRTDRALRRGREDFAELAKERAEADQVLRGKGILLNDSQP